jgi:hypothetical protein
MAVIRPHAVADGRSGRALIVGPPIEVQAQTEDVS